MTPVSSRDPITPAPAALALGPLLLAALAGTMAMMAYVAVAGPITRQLGLPEWVAGLSVTAGGVFWMALARWWGGVSDRRGRKPVLLTGFAICSLAYLIMALGVALALRGQISALSALVLLVATRALIGAVYAAVPPAAAALIADHSSPPERPARMARLGSANALGMVVGPGLAGLLAVHDPALALLFAAALPALALIVLARRLPSTPGPAPGASRPAGAAALHWYDARLRLVCATALVAMSSVAVAQVLVGFFAIDRFGLSPADGARIAGFSLAVVGITQMFAHQFVIRLPTVPVACWIGIGAAIAALGFASVGLASVPLHLLASYGIAAFGMGFVFPSLQAMTANAVERHEQGAAAGLVSSAQGLGMVIAPLAGTILYRLSPSLPFWLIGLMLAALAGSVLYKLRATA